MRTLDELGISPAPWFARLGVMEGDFVNSGAEDNEDGEVCAVALHGYDLTQSHADARLIAAAPMLYEALRGLLNFMPLVALKDSDIGKAMEAAKAALAAAGGESEVANV